MGVAILVGVIAGVIVVALLAGGFWFYRAYSNDQAKKKAMAGKWSGAYSTGNSTLRNIVIFLIVLILFIVIAIVAYVIYYLQQRMGFARQPPSESEMSEP
ncbi:uncharacterized protein LTHEOB_4066 [Neofusicoccum parvum]|nr:uncharacterized protein LTHEOB_4066 [Neofusicoccum parvum]